MNNGGPQFVFFGSSRISVLILERLKEEDLLPSLIVTQPDKPKGRGQNISSNVVKVWAEEHSIQTIEPKNLKETPDELSGNEWDIFVVVSYGKILPKSILDIPTHGVLNVHPSLLPKFRGPSPIQNTILSDEKDTGVTIMLLDEEMDHGPILAQASVSIEDWPPRYEILEELLAEVGGELLAETIVPWINGEIIPEDQNHDNATYVEKISKNEGEIHLEGDPYKNFLKIQALSASPGTFFFVQKGGKNIRVKILDAEYINGELRILRVVPEGKKEMDFDDFKRNL